MGKFDMRYLNPFRIIRLFYSLIFCLRYLPFQQAIKIPICINNKLKISSLKKGQIILPKNSQRFSIIIGLGGSPALQEFITGIHLDQNSQLIFKGKAIISEGCVLRCEKDSIIQFGDNFYCNKNNYFRSSCKISFGDNCLVGWNNTFNTTDGHAIGKKGSVFSTQMAPIIIGNHVWITTHCSFLKGCTISDNCVITQGSIITNKFNTPNVLIGGMPAKEIKYEIDWRK